MRWHFHELLWLLSVTYLIGGQGLADDTRAAADRPTIREVLARFEQGDPGWRVRMEALTLTVEAGADAVPPLLESLQRGQPPAREFAAQALSILADPRAEDALTRALEDPDRGVRIYAVRALSALGKLRLTEDYRQLMRAASDAWPKAPWMDDYLLAAENPPPPPQASQKRRALLDYDLSQMDTARLGHLAPDFTLPDRSGKTVRLSDFRGQVAVLLEFNSGEG